MIITFGIFIVMGIVILYGAWTIVVAVFVLDKARKKK